MTTFYLAPLNKLGNPAFRELTLQAGADYVFSEMVKIDDLLNNDKVQLKKITIPNKQQQKTIIQISAEDINNIEKSIKFIKKYNPKIKEINYNMGCPQSSLCKREIGAGILKNQEKIKQVCKFLHNACKQHNLTPSIKIRLGPSREEINLNLTIKNAAKYNINKIYIHGRTARDPYTKPATYTEIKETIKKFPNIEIIANGDIKDIQTLNKAKQTNPSGIMIGRAALENPNIFKELKTNTQQINKSGTNINQKKELIITFLRLAKKHKLTISQIKANISYLTKTTINGSNFRNKINNINDIDEIIELCNKELK